MQTKPIPKWLTELALRNWPIQLGDTTVQLSALWGPSFYRSISGEHRTELGLAQRFCNVAANETTRRKLRVGDRMVGTSLHYLGDQVNDHHAHRAHTRWFDPSIDRARLYRFQFDQPSGGASRSRGCPLAAGFPGAGQLRTAQSSVDGARASGHALSLCNALAQAACPVAHFVGDLAAAEQLGGDADRACGTARPGGLADLGPLLEGGAADQAPENSPPDCRFSELALDELRRTGYVLRYTGFLGCARGSLGRCRTSG